MAEDMRWLNSKSFRDVRSESLQFLWKKVFEKVGDTLLPDEITATQVQAMTEDEQMRLLRKLAADEGFKTKLHDDFFLKNDIASFLKATLLENVRIAESRRANPKPAL